MPLVFFICDVIDLYGNFGEYINIFVFDENLPASFSSYAT